MKDSAFNYNLKLKKINLKSPRLFLKNLTIPSNQFDQLLVSTWNDAMNRGLFKFKLDKDIPTRYLDGKYSFLVQVNQL